MQNKAKRITTKKRTKTLLDNRKGAVTLPKLLRLFRYGPFFEGLLLTQTFRMVKK